MIAKAHVDVQVECCHCNKVYTISVNPDDLDLWLQGTEFIQDTMPYLTAGERELLISQTCDTCWDKLFTISDD